MKKFSIFCVSCFLGFYSDAQNTITVNIQKQDKQSLPAASVNIKGLKISATANDSGIAVLKNIPNGKYTLEISHVGFKDVEKALIFPLTSADTIEVYLIATTEELDEVTVVSTRSGRSIGTTPTRVEVIGEEEIHEEASMRPGDIRMLLAESTGIQTQQTSATSASAGIRIQGLDGRYTQILKDGFPVYAGAAAGLGLLQTPPLDLRQVEIIKGAASTLYGGGAIAGLINLISKVPTSKRELNFNTNITSGGGLDLNGFYAEKFKKTGVTLFVSRNTNKPFDPAGISFTAIPKFERYTVNPKLFLYCKNNTTINIGINGTVESRLGGDIAYIRGHGDSTHSFFERNKTKRFSTQFLLDHQLNEQSNFKIKNSVSYFNREINSRGYQFNGSQFGSFTEATYSTKVKRADWVAGITVLTDHFTEKPLSTVNLRNYDQNTIGAFVQNTWNTFSWLTLETGIRADYVNDYGMAVLPRVSILFKFAPGFTSRAGVGFGYKPPTIFTEESEKLLYKNVQPVTPSLNKIERSYGANWDVNYRTKFDEVTFSINQFFFFTYLKNPLTLVGTANNLYVLKNIAGHISTRGAETNIRLGFDELALYLGYTYTDARLYNNGIATQNPLTPKHRFNAALVYDVEGKWKFGSELYYFGEQKLTDGTTGRRYWLYGLVAEKIWKRFSLFINFENLGDVRQTKFENIYTGTITNPVFKDIYAPLEGFVVNGGIKLRL